MPWRLISSSVLGCICRRPIVSTPSRVAQLRKGGLYLKSHSKNDDPTLAPGNCRARNDLEEERLARIDAEDFVSKLQEQLADVQHAEVTARQAAETRLSSLTQEYESMKLKVSAYSLNSSTSKRLANATLRFANARCLTRSVLRWQCPTQSVAICY